MCVVIERLRRHPNCILGLTPEGMNSPAGGLALPPAGAGRFILYIQQMGALTLPAAVFEQDGALQVCFGLPYRLTPSAGLSPCELDLQVRQTVMVHIRLLMP